MQWFYFSLGSIIAFTALNIFSKVLIAGSKNQRAFAVVFNICSAFWAVVIFFLISYNKIAFPNITYIAILVVVTAALFYAGFERGRFLAIKNTDASVYVTIFSASTVIAFFGSLILYNESFTYAKLLGLTLIIIATVAVSINEIKLKKTTKVGVVTSIICAVLLGAGWVLDKKGSLLFGAELYNLLVWILPIIFIYLPYIKPQDLKYELKMGNWKIAFIALLNVVAYYLQLRALSVGEATKVIPITQSSIILTVFIGIIVLKEKDFIFRKVIASIITVVGIYLLM